MSEYDHTLSPELWVRKHSDYLYNYALYKVSDEETAQDLVQDTFMAGLKGQNSFKGNSSERTWLVSILKRKIIDHYRKSSVRKTTVNTDFSSPFNADGVFKSHWSDDGAPGKWSIDKSHDLEKDEFQRILEYCLSLLPPHWRNVFHLKMMEECSGEEICKELDLTSSNLWVIIHRAKLKMRACMEKNWFEA
jgi:RNA polymerase sigma-70 factor (ECF subfamily)